MKLSATPVQPPRTPPGLGQDSDDVLREAGYGEEEIAALRAGGVV
jgi:crotonobetainyl-CoA:carnitine CoA-transferase CaiB-like acyl-CoA transferase